LEELFLFKNLGDQSFVVSNSLRWTLRFAAWI
jgi:hypothetical protein